MRPLRVVFHPPPLRQNLCLLQRVKDLAVQELIAQLPVEALTVPVLPRTPRLDVQRLRALKREDVRCGLDAVGGRVAQEPPNIINIHARSPVAGSLSVGFGSPGAGMMIKDAYAYAVAEDGSRVDIAHYDPLTKQPVFSEPKCGVCGSPWPASHRYCEVCLHNEHHSRGKKQRRRK